MKRFQLAWVLLMAFCFTACAQHPSQKQEKRMKQKVLVAYFSCTGNTERVAKAIAKETDGTLYRITPAAPYTDADLNWHNDKSRSSVEMNDENVRPAQKEQSAKAEEYDVIYLGYPIWWDLCPRIVNTFLEAYRLDGKTVIPFATSGSSSITNSVKELKKKYPAIRWQAGKRFSSPNEVKEWIK